MAGQRPALEQLRRTTSLSCWLVRISFICLLGSRILAMSQPPGLGELGWSHTEAGVLSEASNRESLQERFSSEGSLALKAHGHDVSWILVSEL